MLLNQFYLFFRPRNDRVQSRSSFRQPTRKSDSPDSLPRLRDLRTRIGPQLGLDLEGVPEQLDRLHRQSGGSFVWRHNPSFHA